MKEINKNSCLRCDDTLSKQEVKESKEIFDGIVLCVNCRKAFPQSDPIYVVTAKKLKYLLRQQGYSVCSNFSSNNPISILDLQYGKSKAWIIVYDSSLPNHRLEVKLGLDVPYQFFIEDEYLVCLPDFVMNGYPNDHSVNLFTKLSLAFNKLEKERLIREKRVEPIDNTKLLTFQLKTHLGQLKVLKKSHLQIVKQLELTMIDIEKFVEQLEG